MKRRDFLNSIALTLATLGITQIDLQRRSLQYGQVLAQNARRKRALLIGINDYPGLNARDLKTQGLWYRLKGAVNDVELQRELLIHRFGFHPDDILILTDKDATRDNILTQFQHHLLQGIQSDQDVALFHYSGHGSTVIDPCRIFSDHLNGTIVPYDADLPPGYPQKGGEVNDITAGTIFLLREAIARKTKHATFILDSCYSGGGVRGNLILRSRPGQVELADQRTPLVASPAELEAQQRWLTQLGWSEAQWIERRKQGQINGAAIFAAQRNQAAADVTFAGNVHAGIFTYALTRQLWQQTHNEGMGKIIVTVAAKTEQFLKTSANAPSQNPGIEADISEKQLPMYFSPMQRSAADAVITEVRGKAVKLLLAGTEPEILDAIGKGAVLTVVDDQGRSQGQVQVESRDRLTATGTLKTDTAIVPGTMLQEQIRAVPTDLKLRIGLDPSLGEERAIAQTELRSIPRLEVVPLLEQEVHYILGRWTPAYQKDWEKQRLSAADNSPPVINSIGLWSFGFEPIPGSFGAANKPIQQAIQDLRSTFKLLLAARLLKMTLNARSSRLKVVAKIQVANTQELLAESFTVRSRRNNEEFKISTITTTTGLAQVPINQSVQIVIENRESIQDLHVGALIVSPDGDIDVMFPTTDAPNAALVKAQSPQTIGGFKFGKPLGIGELLVVASTAPLQKALTPLQALAQERTKPQRTKIESAQKTETAIASLLDDLASTTRGESPSATIRQLDVQQMSTLAIAFEIVEELATKNVQ